jgi:hypothetical protein
MPTKIIKNKDGSYRVISGGKVVAKKTTKIKAENQKRLLDALEHDFKPKKKKKG